MKRIILCTALALSTIACKKESAEATTTEVVTDSAQTPTKTTGTAIDKGTFDINSIPVSDKDLGTFPYLNAPDTYKYNMGDDGISKSDISDFDKEYFAVNGKLMAQEGKTCKVFIEKKQGTGPFNSLIAEKSYEKAILALGGVQVNNVPVPQSEINRIGNKN